MTHTTTAKAVRGGLLAAVVLLVACAAAPAGATSARSPGDWLYLTVTRSDVRPQEVRPEGMRSRDVLPGGTRAPDTRFGDSRAWLLCDPPQGHPRAAEACAQLDATGGDPRAVPPRDTFCTMVHAPVTARARGEWHGRPVNYEETYPNACVLAARTGAVFALDG